MSRVCWTTPGIAEIGTGSQTPSRTNAGRIRSAGCRRYSATIRRMAGVVRSRRGRAPGKLPYFVIQQRYARPTPAFADWASDGSGHENGASGRRLGAAVAAAPRLLGAEGAVTAVAGLQWVRTGTSVCGGAR